MDFNKKKCLALLKEKKKLDQEGKFFWDFDKAKNKELTGYLSLYGYVRVSSKSQEENSSLESQKQEWNKKML